MGQPYPGPWTFNHHPWLRQIHDDQSDVVIGMKAAQMGYTETALNKTFAAIDLDGRSVLYVLPSESDASDFSSGRFDPALDMSPHLATLFSDVKNMGHKRAGNANLYVRGSRSRSKLKSLPVSLIVLDELDEMIQENIALVQERTSGQLQQQIFMLSTPSIPKYGIDSHYQDSTQNHYMFKCPSCSRRIELIFPESLVVTSDNPTRRDILDSHIICTRCKAILPHEGKSHFLKNGIWVPTYEDRLASGYHINQLYSPTVHPAKIAIQFLKAEGNPTTEQELYNSKMGLTHTVEGARVTDAMIEAVMCEYKKPRGVATSNRLITMGVDVGKWLHVVIYEWELKGEGVGADINEVAEPRLLNETKVEHFEQLDDLMIDYRVHYAVVDANPERRKAQEFAGRYPGRISICFYTNSQNGKSLVLDEERHSVSVDRTTWLDISLGRYKMRRIKIPCDSSLEFRDQIKALTRIYTKDKNDNPVGRYVKGNEDDHFAHAANYAEIALPLANQIAHNYSLQGVL